MYGSVTLSVAKTLKTLISGMILQLGWLSILQNVPQGTGMISRHIWATAQFMSSFCIFLLNCISGTSSFLVNLRRHATAK